MVGFRAAVRELRGTVSADLLESDDAYLLVIDLPGATAERTAVSTSEDSLTVHANRESAHSNEVEIIRQERPQELEFEIPLPPDADAEAARASLADGVLEVTIPRDTDGVTIPIEEA